MKQQLFFIAAVLFSFCGFVQAQDGLSCETAIPVDTSYVGSVPAAGTYYYSASTYDLPMTCYFYPETSVSELPKVYVDFTCTPGYYEDSLLSEILTSVSGWGIQVPVPFSFKRLEDATVGEYYYLTIEESYREMLANFSVTYDVEAIIQFNAPCAGRITMAHDVAFRDCIESAEWVSMPDNVPVGLEQLENVYVLPFSEWRNDSILVRWTGTESPITIWIGETCDFELNTIGENCALDMFVLYPDAGNGENIRTFSRREINDYISLFGKGGVYYMRAITSEDAELSFEYKPMSEAMKNAIRIEKDQPFKVAANSEQVYYFPWSWLYETNILWTSSASKRVEVYLSDCVNFEAKKDDAHVLGCYAFQPALTGRELALTQKQLSSLDLQRADQYIYAKFIAEEPTTITCSDWSLGDCAEGTFELYPNDSVQLQRNASSTAWRMNINQWAKQDVKLYWKGSSSLEVFLCDTCKGFYLNKSNAHVKFYNKVTINTNGTRDTLTISKDVLSGLTQYADADGFMYFRFNNGAVNYLIVKADVKDPDPTINPEDTIPADTIPTLPSAVALVLDSTITIPADDVVTTYYFTNDWANLSVEFEANSADSITAYFGKTADFNIFGREADYVAAYPFYVENNQSRLQFSAKQINTLLSSNATDTLFVVFYSYNATQVTPMLWHVCACVENSMELMPVDRKVLLSLTYNDVYRVKYSEWQKHDVRLHWNSDVALRAYLADTCDFKLTPKNKHVLNKSNVDVLPNDTLIIGEEVRTLVINEGRLPDDGFLYFRFYSQDSGILTTSYPGSSDPGNNPGPGTGVDNTVVGDALRRIICTPDGTIYILVGEDRYTILGEKL